MGFGGRVYRGQVSIWKGVGWWGGASKEELLYCLKVRIVITQLPFCKVVTTKNANLLLGNG